MSEIQNKMITIEEAAEIIPDGSNLAIGGFAETNNPMSIVRQLIRMRKRHLELSGMGDAQSAELLCGAGCVDKIRFSNYILT